MKLNFLTIGYIIIPILIVTAYLSITLKYSDFVITGDINKKNEEKIKNFINYPIPIFVDTDGGGVDSAERIAKILYEKNKSLYIINECSSACAEFFIPSAKKVFISKKALIGYHISNFMSDEYFHSEHDKSAFCGSKALEWQKSRYVEKKYNSKFYKQTMKRLRFEPIYEIDNVPIDLTKYGRREACKGMYFWQSREMWYPTSKQLRELLGLNVDHEICSDSKECWKPKIDSWNPRPGEYVIGDEVYPPDLPANTK